MLTRTGSLSTAAGSSLESFHAHVPPSIPQAREDTWDQNTTNRFSSLVLHRIPETNSPLPTSVGKFGNPYSLSRVEYAVWSGQLLDGRRRWETERYIPENEVQPKPSPLQSGNHEARLIASKVAAATSKSNGGKRGLTWIACFVSCTDRNRLFGFRANIHPRYRVNKISAAIVVMDVRVGRERRNISIFLGGWARRKAARHIRRCCTCDPSFALINCKCQR